MTNELAKLSSEEIVVQFGVDLAAIEAKKLECSALEFDTPANYKMANKALGEVRDARTGVEKRRKELKADALEYGRKVDAAAKMLTGFILEVEEPLQAKKDATDKAKDAEREAKAAAVRAAEEARIRAANEAREAELRVEMEAKEKALAEAQAKIDAANAELAAKQEAFAKEQSRITELQEAETQRIAAETRRIAEEKRQAELAEARRVAAIEAERVARETAERELAEAHERRVAELERVAALKAREEALKPDKEKLAAFAKSIMEFTTNNAPCGIVDPAAVDAMTECLTAIDDAASDLLEFTK